MVRIVASDSAVAGNIFTLTCSVMATPDNISSNTVLMWRGPGVDQSNVQVSSSSFAAVLTFNPLCTSHGGVYTCEARLVDTNDLLKMSLFKVSQYT